MMLFILIKYFHENPIGEVNSFDDNGPARRGTLFLTEVWGFEGSDFQGERE